MLRVRGESMIGAGILDGDYVVVRQQSEELFRATSWPRVSRVGRQQ